MIQKEFSDWGLMGKYNIEKQIGAGSYGAVVKARHAVTGKLVAIKRIVRIFSDLVDAKRILREIALLKRLNHPNIVTLIEVIVPDNELDNFDELFLVLEKAPLDLKKLLYSRTYLTFDQITSIIYDVLLALKYMHSAGVWHRDLKPANILVFDDYKAKVCDFGLARTVDQSVDADIPQSSFAQIKPKSAAQLTSHVVTRWYRAPELILVESNYTEKIDIWSLGCIFAELLQMVKEILPSPSERKPFFPGKSCFPLSPDAHAALQASGFRVSEADQLLIVMQKLGSPSDSDLEFITDPKARAYIKSLGKTPRLQMTEILPKVPAVACSFLEGCLQFSPCKRLSVDECLIHPLFKDIRTPMLERTAKEKFDTELDKESVIPYPELRKLFKKEISSQVQI